MRDAACCFLVLASLAGTASAELAPEDPYPDVAPLDATRTIPLEIDATSGVGPVVAMPAATVNGVPVEGAAAAGIPQATAKVETPASPTNATSESIDQLDGEWYEQQEVQIGGGVGAGLVLLGLVIRGRRAARRRRLAREQRRTQFGMSAVDPSLAKFNVAAWEAAPAVMPIAIEPEMMNRRARSAIVQQAPTAQPYRHYSEADRAAYGVRSSYVPSTAAPRAAPKMVMMPHLLAAPHVRCRQLPLPSMPIAVAHAPAAQPPARGSWHPTVMPWEQAAPSSAAPHAAPQGSQPPHAFAAAPAAYPVAPLPAVALPRGAQLPAPVHHARAFSPAPAIAPDNVRLMRLADGTPPPPCAPQPFTSLPAPYARPLPGLPAPADPAPYPLTFPAFPETAGATMLAAIEPSGLNYWGPQPTEIEVQDDQILFARGSQPVEQLEPVRRTLSALEDETRIARSPHRRR